METLIIVLGLLLLSAVVFYYFYCAYLIYKKAGRPGWYVFVPFLNSCVWLRMGGLSGWLMPLFFVPFAGIFLNVYTSLRISKAFQKGWGAGLLLALFPWAGLPLLAFTKNEYVNPLTGQTPGKTATPAEAAARKEAVRGNPAALAVVSLVLALMLFALDLKLQEWGKKMKREAQAYAEHASLKVGESQSAKSAAAAGVRTLETAMAVDSVAVWQKGPRTLTVRLYSKRLAYAQKESFGQNPSAAPQGPLIGTFMAQYAPQGEVVSFGEQPPAVALLILPNQGDPQNPQDVYDVKKMDFSVTGLPQEGDRLTAQIRGMAAKNMAGKDRPCEVDLYLTAPLKVLK